MAKPKAKPKCVLVVDDDPFTREDLEQKLTALEVEVALAESGPDALEQISEKRLLPAAVIADIRMPLMDGFELAGKLNDMLPKVPVVLMTAADDIQSPIRAMRHRAFDFLVKPVKIDDMQRLLLRLQQVWEQAAPLSEIIEGDYVALLALRVPTQLNLTRHVAAKFRDHYRDNLDNAGCDPNRFMVALIEALENAVIHGNLGMGSELRDLDFDVYDQTVRQRMSDPTYGRRHVTINTKLTRRLLQVKVTDQGAGFDFTALPEDDNDQQSLMCSGRGVLIIRDVMDRVSWEDGGRTICMEVDLKPAEPADNA